MTQKEIIECNLGTYTWCRTPREFVTADEARWAIESISHYEGWGRCGKVINPQTEEYKTAVQYLKDYGHKQSDIKDIMSKVQSSTLTSFYTPTDMAKTITRYALDKYKELNGKPAKAMLDPSCGTGAFITDIEDSELVAVCTCEKDEITRTILETRLKAMKKLARYRGRKVQFGKVQEAYEYEALPFDVIVSNMPFGQVGVYDRSMDRMGGVYKASQKMIHNYYFMKSLLLLKDGGIMAFITTRGFLSSPKNEPYREEMLKHGRVLNIVRLPDNLFPTVDVGSDLIVYHKTGKPADERIRLNRIFKYGWLEDEDDLQLADEIGRCIPNCEHTMKKNQYGKLVQHYKYVGDDMPADLRSCLYGIRCTRAEHHDNHFYFYFE